MKALSKLWGLVYDDPWLFGTVVLFLIAAVVLRVVHLYTIASIAIWVGLVVALILAVEAELRRKLRSGT